MKRTALFLGTALLATTAFAAEPDLCDTNLQQLDDTMTTESATIGTPMKGELDGLITEAKEAKAAGDTEACIASSTKALQMLKQPGEGTSAGGGSS